MVIRPKFIRPLPLRPGSSDELLSQIVKSSEALWREGTVENMAKQTLNDLASTFALDTLLLMHWQGLESPQQLRGTLLAAGAKAPQAFLQAQQQKLKEAIESVDRQHSDWDIGLQRLQLETEAFNLAFIAHSPDDCFVMMWPERSAQGLSYLQELALEFAVKQLQTSSRWSSRFSEAQALLQIDDLTGLFNQRYLHEAIEREVKRSQRYGSSFSLLFIDLDNFKPVNDTYGHLAGSSVLREVGKIIKGTLRDVDLVFRFGGDEFVVLLIEADAKNGLKTAERIRDRIQIADFIVGEGQVCHVSASVGLATFPEHAHDKEALLALADGCMYESKRLGKNQVVMAQSAPPLEVSQPETLRQKN